MVDLSTSCLHAVVSSSWRLREELVEALVGQWTGPIKRVAEPDDLARFLVGMDTPSLFEEPALVLVRANDKYLNKHRELLLPLIGQPVVGGVLVVITDTLPKNQTLGKRLNSAKCWHGVDLPGPKQVQSWLLERLMAIEHQVQHPGRVVEALLRHRGGDPDSLLASIDQLVDYAGDEPVTPKIVDVLVGGDAEQPIWMFTDAFLGGQAGKAIRLLHAGRGLEIHAALGALATEIRRCLGALASSDDAEACALAGVPRRGSLYHTRRRADGLGRRCLQRLLNGIYQAQRDLRRKGSDPVIVMEVLIQQAQRVIRSA